MARKAIDTDALLMQAREAMRDYDPGDGEPIDSPAWRLLLAVEELDKALIDGAELPRAWEPGRSRDDRNRDMDHFRRTVTGT